ncbi:MAG: ATP-binding protein [Candidatus Krumholzibacteria bacterium]|jgi:sugar lactone lactonase YvrE|nr:ATP-binding protein [Candidatus Krumholzibacteria bacterium]
MKRSAAIIFLILAVTSSGSGAVSLVKKWETDRVFKTPESVVYDAERHILYVSNICGGPDEKDGNGFISQLSMKGEIVSLKWIGGLNAPKGMGISGTRLYVADVDELVEIDVEKGKVLARHPAPGAKFLNDVAVGSGGAVYISDSAESQNAIYRFDGEKVELWARAPSINRPNGLLVDGGNLVIGVSGHSMLKRVDIETGKISDIVTIGSAIDGVAMDGKGNFIVSDWKGRTMLVEPSGGIYVLLDTAAAGVNSADICFLPKWKMLLIPTFSDNRVVACTLVY